MAFKLCFDCVFLSKPANFKFKQGAGISSTNTTDSHSIEIVQTPQVSTFMFEDKLDGLIHKRFDYINNSDIILDVKNTTIIIPDSNVLILQNLNLTMKKHENILIAGPSGAGKVIFKSQIYCVLVLIDIEC